MSLDKHNNTSLNSHQSFQRSSSTQAYQNHTHPTLTKLTSRSDQQQLIPANIAPSMQGIMKGELTDFEARTNVYLIEGLSQTEKN